MQFVSTKRKIFGQGMTEYIIIVALISIAAIFVVNKFGGVVKGQFGHMASQLSGSTDKSALTSSKDAGKAAREDGTKAHNLSDYGAAR